MSLTQYCHTQMLYGNFMDWEAVCEITWNTYLAPPLFLIYDSPKQLLCHHLKIYLILPIIPPPIQPRRQKGGGNQPNYRSVFQQEKCYYIWNWGATNVRIQQANKIKHQTKSTVLRNLVLVRSEKYIHLELDQSSMQL